MVTKIARFTGIPFQNKPWPDEAPWQLSVDNNPYKALLIVDGNEKFIKDLQDSSSCCFYDLEIETYEK